MKGVSKFFGETRKIRTASLDTNVISDVPFILNPAHGKFQDKKYIERCNESFKVIVVLLSAKIKLLGLTIVRKELEIRPHIAKLYSEIFDTEIEINREIRQIARDYIRKTALNTSDAVILASVSLGNIDMFLSWNREHIVNPNTFRIVKEINSSRGIKFPLILTPKMFLERFFITEDKTICFTPTPVPQQFHPRFSFPI